MHKGGLKAHSFIHSLLKSCLLAIFSYNLYNTSSTSRGLICITQLILLSAWSSLKLIFFNLSICHPLPPNSLLQRHHRLTLLALYLRLYLISFFVVGLQVIQVDTRMISLCENVHAFTWLIENTISCRHNDRTTIVKDDMDLKLTSLTARKPRRQQNDCQWTTK